MEEPNEISSATVPEQPEAKPPLRKGAPVIVTLVAIVALIGIANLSSLVSGNKKAAPASALPMRPSAPNAAQVNSFETQQQVASEARRGRSAAPTGVSCCDATIAGVSSRTWPRSIGRAAYDAGAAGGDLRR